MPLKVIRPIRISPAGALSTFFKCSYQYKLRNLEEVSPDPNTDNLYAVLGSSLHKAMQLHEMFGLSYEELRKNWKVLFLNYLTEARHLEEGIEYRNFLSRGYDLLKAAFELRERWANKTEFIAAEKYCRFTYENPFLKSIYLSGQIDLVVKDNEGNYIALDWKTSRSVNKDIDNDLQMTFYIFYIHKLFNVDYDKIFGALVYPSTKKILFTQRDESDVKRIMFDKIDLMLERLSKNDFKKEPKINNKPDDCTFCPYLISCEKL